MNCNSLLQLHKWMIIQFFCFLFLNIDLFYLFICLFVFWLCWIFVAVCGLSLVAASGGYSLLWCAGFSLRWLLLLRSTGSRHAGFSSCGSRALEHRFSSCGARAQLLRGMWDLPGTGLEPGSPCIGRQILNHCATREARSFSLNIF